jgi:hypothetical protein
MVSAVGIEPTSGGVLGIPATSRNFAGRDKDARGLHLALGNSKCFAGRLYELFAECCRLVVLPSHHGTKSTCSRVPVASA